MYVLFEQIPEAYTNDELREVFDRQLEAEGGKVRIQSLSSFPTINKYKEFHDKYQEYLFRCIRYLRENNIVKFNKHFWKLSYFKRQYFKDIEKQQTISDRRIVKFNSLLDRYIG